MYTHVVMLTSRWMFHRAVLIILTLYASYYLFCNALNTHSPVDLSLCDLFVRMGVEEVMDRVMDEGIRTTSTRIRKERPFANTTLKGDAPGYDTPSI